MNRIAFHVPRFSLVALTGVVLAVASPSVRMAFAVHCPPRAHLDPAANERCGRDHYESAAAAQRCAYADRVARMTADERDQCGIDEKGNPKPEHPTLDGSAYELR